MTFLAFPGASGMKGFSRASLPLRGKDRQQQDQREFNAIRHIVPLRASAMPSGNDRSGLKSAHAFLHSHHGGFEGGDVLQGSVPFLDRLVQVSGRRGQH